jgi:hypothetical protein
MTDDGTDNNQESRKGDALDQLASVAVAGSSVQTEPGTDPDDISDDS